MDGFRRSLDGQFVTVDGHDYSEVTRPKLAQADQQERLPDGSERPLPTRTLHLMAAEDGTAPVDLNDWERQVLDSEAAEPSLRGWYRNPSRASKQSLAIPFQDGAGQWQALRPDFVFFHANQDGTIRADIVDPHGTHLADALPKLRGLAEYAQAHGMPSVGSRPSLRSRGSCGCWT
mgnify:CR=1 FL=1